MSTVKIGVFDSGIGGFSILKELFTILPKADVYYIADHEFCPYGEKKDHEIIQRSCEMVELLLSKNVEMILVACNTATTVAIEVLREKYPVEFVGVEPYLNIINQKEKIPPKANIAAIMTQATFDSKKFQNLKTIKDPDGHITCYPLKNLAHLIETHYGHYENKKFISSLQDQLKNIKSEHTHLILGCTHYSLVAHIISDELGVECVSPCKYVVKQMLTKIHKELTDKPPENFHFYSTNKNIWESIKRDI